MDRIAREAELAKGTLYLYFRSKDELLMGLIANDMEMLIERINRIIEKPVAADEKLIQAFAEFHAFSKENQFFFQVMTQLNIVQMVNGEYSQETLEKFSSTNHNVVGLIKQIVQEGVDSNLFQLHASVHDVVVQLIIALKGSIVILTNNMVPPFWVQQEERVLLEQIVRTLVCGISQQRPHTNERGVQQ
jgi:TetR/AcrR family fatty acid metabolism transcriptional regulator